jgi:hypothetical protein
MRWRDTDWLAEAAAWIGERAEPTGELEQTHVEAWSTVLRVPTADGTLWFKAVAPDHAFEPQLTALLGRLLPDRVPELVAVDLDQAWMLMQDGGERLRELPARVEHWERVLSRYAELQIAATPHADELLALGVPDERLEGLRSWLEEALSEKPKGLSTRAYRQMLERLPDVEAIAEELTAHGIAETLQHDDLHGWPWQRPAPGRPRQRPAARRRGKRHDARRPRQRPRQRRPRPRPQLPVNDSRPHARSPSC